MSWLVVAGALLLSAGTPALASERAEQELTCLALNIYHEARNQPLEGQLAVAHVTLNRLAERSPSTICEVVYHGWSFSWTRDPRKRQPPTDQRAWDVAKAVARWAISDRDSDPVDGSTFFHSVSVEPEWAPTMERVRQIGDHIFYRDAGATREERLAQEPGESR